MTQRDEGVYSYRSAKILTAIVGLCVVFGAIGALVAPLGWWATLLVAAAAFPAGAFTMTWALRRWG